MADRATFIAGIRSRLQQYQPTHAPDSPWTPRPDRPGISLPASSDLPELFLQELRALGGHGQRVSTLVEARRAILDLVQQRAAGRLIRWQGADLDALDLDGSLGEMGVSIVTWEPSATLREDVARADIGLSEAELGIAETGSLLLASGPGQARSVTLLPPTLITLLRVERIVPRVADAVYHYVRLGDLPASLSFHTGPSRSADIEQNLAIGVHGPGDVHALLVG